MKIFLFTKNALVLCATLVAAFVPSNVVVAQTTNTVDTANNNNNDVVVFGVIQMQLRSRSTSSKNDLLFHLLSQTGHFLDEMLSADFETTDHDFSHTTMSVIDFELTQQSVPSRNKDTPDDSTTKQVSETFVYDAFVQLHGRASFAKGTAPSNDEQVRQMVNNAFQHENALFLQQLTTSTMGGTDSAVSNAFLRDITFTIVSVNGKIVAQDGEDENRPAPRTQNGDESTGSGLLLEPWMIALVIVGGLVAIALGVCIVCVCCMPVDDDDDSRLPTTANNPPVPKTKPSIQTATMSNDDDSDIPDSISGSRSVSPSPLHSIASQDSSAFTFNPDSVIYGMPSGTGGLGVSAPPSYYAGGVTAGSASTAEFNINNNSTVEVDVEAWQKRSTIAGNANTTLPFGNDISAISNKKDLSLIEEEELSGDSTPNSSGYNSAAGRSRGSRLSSNNVAELERADRRRGGRLSSGNNDSDNYRRKSGAGMTQKYRHKKEPQGAKPINLNGSAADVIDELNDLSAQIDDYRRR